MTMPNLSAWAVRNPALVLFLMLICLAAGARSYWSLGRAEDPPFTIKAMVVSASWPGATADEMQRLVADPIETRIRSLPHLDHVQSYSRADVTVLNVVLKDSTPPGAVDELFYQVRKKVQDVRPSLPAALRGPFFNDEYSDVYAAVYMLTAPELQQQDLLVYVERLRQRLLRIADIDKAEIVGERPRRVFVEISHRRLATLGIPFSAIAQALQQQNESARAGAVETQGERIHLRIDGALASEEAVADTAVIAGGRSFRLGDIAEIRRGYEDPPAFLVRFDGEDAIGLSVRMRAGANGLALGRELAAAVEEVRASLPLGVELAQITDQAAVIDEAVSEFQLKFAVAVGVVLLISLVALGFSAGIIVALSVPLTLAITFVAMELAGMQFHRITLGALILALGLLVDDAIIAIEMMLVKIEAGYDRVRAATFAWTATAFPMLTGTLVTIAGFLPVGFARSTAGEYAGGIFWIVAIALTASWFVAVVFTPWLGVRLLPRSLEARAAARGGHDPYDTPGFDRFRRLVAFVLRRRFSVIALVLISGGVAGLAFTQVPKQFFPQSERRELMVELRGPEGASFALTRAQVEAAEALVVGRPEVAHVTSFVGAGAPRFYLALNPVLPNDNFGLLLIMTKSNADREALRARLIAHFAREEGAVRGRVLRLEFGPPTGHPVQFRVNGPDPEQVRAIAAQVRDVMRANTSTRDVELQWSEEAKTIRLSLDQARARALGVSSAELAQTLQTLLSGAAVTQLREDNRLVDVVARATSEERAALATLDDLTVTTRRGGAVPLAQLARLEVSSEQPILWRRNGDVTLAVRADVVDGVQGPDVSRAVARELGGLIAGLPIGYRIEAGGAIEESGKADAALFTVLPAMFLAMLTLIMLQMRSFGRTLLVFLTFPLGFIGGSLSLYLTGLPFGFVALLGILALGGIIVRNTLILADQIETEVAAGRTLHDAIVETTVRRARPVVLTALAAVLAFVPLTQTAFWAPLAFVLIGGTLIGTVLTLLFLPALYAAWFRARSEAAARPAAAPALVADARAAFAARALPEAAE